MTNAAVNEQGASGTESKRQGKARQGVLLQLASRCLLLLLLHNANVPAIIQLSSI